VKAENTSVCVCVTVNCEVGRSAISRSAELCD
jgi:hypothetical protein